jgi:hypothetical protein
VLLRPGLLRLLCLRVPNLALRMRQLGLAAKPPGRLEPLEPALREAQIPCRFPSSSSEQSESATPVRPARPVRPTRCT